MLTTSSPVSSSAETRDLMDRREERVPTYLRVERREESMSGMCNVSGLLGLSGD